MARDSDARRAAGKDADAPSVDRTDAACSGGDDFDTVGGRIDADTHIDTATGDSSHTAPSLERLPRHPVGTVRTIASGLIPLGLVVVLVAYVFGPGADMLDVGVPLPEITIERVDFVDSEIRAVVRNTGPIPVSVVMADINDRIHPAAVEPDGHLQRYETALVRIPFDWNEAEPYVIGMTLGDGTRFEREVEAAAPALEPSAGVVGFFAVIGAYVGVIPVLIGMLWLPFIRRMGRSVYVFFLAVTVGLLFFLALDSIEEAVSVSQESLAGSFNGLMLLATSVVLSFLGLYYVGERLACGGTGSGSSTTITRKGRGGMSGIARPIAISLMISIGIGLHNFGEGLAIGAAVGLGSVAFSTFLIVGFAIHNVTEGVAIAAPLSRVVVRIWRLALFGAIAGVPAIFGGWVGVLAYSPFTSVIFLGVGAGAIFQVMLVLVRWITQGGDDTDATTATTTVDNNVDSQGASLSKDSGKTRSSSTGVSGAPFVSGLAVGMLVMYVTSILV